MGDDACFWILGKKNIHFLKYMTTLIHPVLSKENSVLSDQIPYWYVIGEVMFMQQIHLFIHILPIGYGMIWFLDIVCSIPFRKKSVRLVVISGNNSYREA